MKISEKHFVNKNLIKITWKPWTLVRNTVRYDPENSLQCSILFGSSAYRNSNIDSFFKPYVLPRKSKIS